MEIHFSVNCFLCGNSVKKTQCHLAITKQHATVQKCVHNSLWLATFKPARISFQPPNTPLFCRWDESNG